MSYTDDNLSIHSHETASTVIDVEDLEKMPYKTYTTQSSEPYCVFSKNKKTLIVAICCITGLASPLTANIYFPALDVIQNDLNTTTELINLTVTVYMIFQGISPSFWGSLADLWGRRPVYLSTLIVYIGACIGLALTPNYTCLLILRMLQAFGASSMIAIGAGVIGDISTPAERGSYFGMFSMGQMLGPVIGPVIGGVVSEYLSWRWIFWVLFILGCFFFVLVLFFLPETLRTLVGNGSGYANPTPTQWWKNRKQQMNTEDDDITVHENSTTEKSRFLQMPNMSEPYKNLLEKDVIVALVFNGIIYAAYYCYQTSITSQFTLIYNMDESQIGLCFLIQGIGCILGSFSEGLILDYDFKKVSQQFGYENTKRGNLPMDFPIFRARLRTVWIPAVVFQIITIMYGWLLSIHAPLPLVLVLQFFVGLTSISIFNVFQTLLVDLFPGKSATITASNNLVRCLLGAMATVVIDPGIQGVGVGWMFTIVGCICALSNILLIVLCKYGPCWRTERIERLANNLKN